MEQKLQREAEINEYYGNIVNGILEQNQNLKKYMIEDTFDSIAILYETDKQAFKNLTEDEQSQYRKTLEALLKMYADNFNSWEEMTEEEKKAMKDMMDQYEALYGHNSQVYENMTDKEKEHIDTVIDAFKSGFENNIENFRNMKEALESDMIGNDGLLTTWDSGIQEMADKMVGDGGFWPVVEEAISNATEAAYKYEEDLQSVADTVGLSLEDLARGIDEDAEKTRELTFDNAELIFTWEEQIQAISDLIFRVIRIGLECGAGCGHCSCNLVL